MSRLASPERRRRGPAPRLNRAMVIEAAVAVMDERGLARLTMARLARALEVTPMALYGYVTDKQDLVEALIDRVVGEAPLPGAGADDGPWDDALAAAMRGLRALLLRHPGLGQVLADQPLRTPRSFEWAAHCIRILRGAGFNGTEAVRAYYALLTYTLGFSTWELPRAHASSGPTSYADAVAEFVHEAPPASRSVLSDVVPALQTSASEEQFEYGLQRLLHGIRVHP